MADESDNITGPILRQIRDEIIATRVALTERIDATNTATNERLDATNEHLAKISREQIRQGETVELLKTAVFLLNDRVENIISGAIAATVREQLAEVPAMKARIEKLEEAVAAQARPGRRG